MRTLILTGPSGAGKNAVAEAMSNAPGQWAVIDVDAVRKNAGPKMIPNAAYCEMVANGAAPPDEECNQNDWQPGVRITVNQARELQRAGNTVSILDVLSGKSAQMYRQELAGVFIVLLLPTREEIERRYRQRAQAEGLSRLGDDRFIDLLYQHQRGFTDFDIKIDNTNLFPARVATHLAGLIFSDEKGS
jgi:chloramphenicol 3-O-phosphotransferase